MKGDMTSLHDMLGWAGRRVRHGKVLVWAQVGLRSASQAGEFDYSGSQALKAF